MRLFDTLSEQTKTIDFPDGVVKMYVCGITPYDTSHMGHARVGIVYDTLRRYLEWCGLTVRYVQNITDIDDPLFERARRDKVDWRVLGEQQTAHYLQSLEKVNVERPHFYIKATSEIAQMVPVIAELIERGHAYVVEGAVYYSVVSEPDFGTIFHDDYAAMLATANERGNDPNDPHKRDPLDFVLWQHSQADEPAWPSPWGPGRPGWHIECSTIATSYLGPQIDIHGGGTDLIFPHHACEIAQAEPVTEVVPFVRAWMHVGMVYLNGEKMSKSLGNMIFVDAVLQTNSAAALRLAILNQPYREPYEYRDADVLAAEQHVTALRHALAAPRAVAADQAVLDGTAQRKHFTQALDDNFDTPGAIRVLRELAAAIDAAVSIGHDVRPAQQVLSELTGVLGLML